MLEALNANKVFGFFDFYIKRESSSIIYAYISVQPSLVNKIRKHTLEVYKYKIKTKGFGEDNTPEHYAENNCALGINDSCNRFIHKFFVQDFLDEKIKEQRIVCLSPAKLISIELQPSGAIMYIFKLSTISNIVPDNWEKIHFVSPKRKLYKDLDKQAVCFVKKVEEDAKKNALQKTISSDGDWINFSAILLNNNNQPAIRNFKNNFWLKLDTKYVSTPLHKSFLAREENECFSLENLSIVGTESDLLSSKGKFRITINNIIKANDFSLKRFRSIFKLETVGQVHEKLIEIFSFRNDISQRRLIIDEAFRVLFNKIKFEIPRYLVLRGQEKLLESIKRLPDYNVYKMNENFEKQVCLLAEKQIKEEALIKQIGYNEGIGVSKDDVLEYLNLLSHPRLVEFVYFLPNIEFINDICLPIKESVLKATVLKEKVLNFIINQLTAKRNHTSA